MNVSVPTNFTLNELLAYLETQRDKGQDEGYLTSREWARKFGVSVTKIADILIEAKEAKILLVSKAERPCVDDVVRKVPVYAFKERQPA